MEKKIITIKAKVEWSDYYPWNTLKKNRRKGGKDRPSLAGNRLRENEDLSKLEIRWVETERPLAVWEDLVKQHITEHSFFPKYIPTKKQKRHI